MTQPYNETELAEAVSRIIRSDPDMIFAFKAKYVSTEDWEYAIHAKPSIFAKCKDKTPNMCVIAVALDGFNLEYIDPVEHSENFYMELCKTAVNQNPKAITVVPKEFRTKELKAFAYANDPDLLISEKKLTPGMIESIIEHNPNLIKYVVDPTDDIIIKALSADPRVIVYFKSISPRVRDYFEEYYPQYASMLIHD